MNNWSIKTIQLDGIIICLFFQSYYKYSYVYKDLHKELATLGIVL